VAPARQLAAGGFPALWNTTSTSAPMRVDDPVVRGLHAHIESFPLHRRIGYICGPRTTEVSLQRLRGFSDEIVWMSIECGGEVEFTAVEGQFDYRSGEEMGRKLLEAPANVRATAIATANDQQAIGLLRCSRDMGIRVPQDLSIVGFDDIPLASLVLPRLTTIRQPVHEIAEIAIHAVLGRSVISGSILLPPSVVERESTAACRDTIIVE
jgi:LacI family transcriptional regulator